VRCVITFVVVFIVAVVVIGRFGAVGPYELLFAIVLAALAAAFVARRRKPVAKPRSGNLPT
jgi:hypothetical protein